jgi:DNA-binding SARP family transcriptional activator
VPLARLLDWLWPEAGRAAGATTLRSAISGLRHTLEPESGARASSRYILTRAGGYAWNMAAGAWVDAEEFLALTDERRRTLRLRSGQAKDEGRRISDDQSSSPDTRHLLSEVDRLERATALYRGDYLADEPDAPWSVATRELLRERFLSALHDLAELRLASGANEAASDLARRGLEYERLREPFYRILMKAQARAGDVASALQSYERCRQALDEELGAAPSAQTRALHAAILRGEEGLSRAGEGESGRRTPPRSLSRSPTLPRAASPFVGRGNELAALKEWIGALEQQRGGVVAVVGEAGIGKTRLVAEALQATREVGAFTVMLCCAAIERELPFAPLSEALRPLLRAAPVDTLKRLPPAALAQVADLLPVLRERLPDLPKLVSPPGDAQQYLLDGLVDLALALAREHPLIIWCDDAQWADDATLAAVGRLARRSARRALLLVLAYRSGDLAENVALHDLLRTLSREMLLRQLPLSRLEHAEVAQLLAELARVAPARVAGLAPRLWASSAGNPLFLSVALQSLLESRGARSLAALLPELESNAPLPDLADAPPLRDLVLSRVERLPEAARALLEQLAVIGVPASLDLIEQLAGSAGLEAARMLLERQFLAEDADERLAFNHDLVRSIVVASLTSPRRRRLHRDAAAAIAKLHGQEPERAAELALHFEQAGHGAEAEVLHYATAAGDHARRSYGYRVALDYYELGLRAVDRMAGSESVEAARRAFAGSLMMREELLDWDGIMDTAVRFDRWAGRWPNLAPLVNPRRLVLLRALMGDLAGAAALSVEQARRQPEPLPALEYMLWRTGFVLLPF